MRKTMLLPWLILLSASSCVTIGQNDSFCALAHPIYLEDADMLTPNTQREILSHDKTGYVKCGWKMV
jgi:hypothetical protein